MGLVGRGGTDIGPNQLRRSQSPTYVVRPTGFQCMSPHRTVESISSLIARSLTLLNAAAATYALDGIHRLIEMSQGQSQSCIHSASQLTRSKYVFPYISRQLFEVISRLKSTSCKIIPNERPVHTRLPEQPCSCTFISNILALEACM